MSSSTSRWWTVRHQRQLSTAGNYVLVVDTNNVGVVIDSLAAVDARTARINLQSPLSDGTYRLTLASTLSDLAGNPLADPRVFRFTVAANGTDEDPPVILAGLANDTAPGAGSNSDGFTSDPAIAVARGIGGIGQPKKLPQVTAIDRLLRLPQAAEFLQGPSHCRSGCAFVPSLALL